MPRIKRRQPFVLEFDDDRALHIGAVPTTPGVFLIFTVSSRQSRKTSSRAHQDVRVPADDLLLQLAVETRS